MIIAVLGFLFGICILHLCAELPSLFIVIFLILLFFVIYQIFIKIDKKTKITRKRNNTDTDDQRIIPERIKPDRATLQRRRIARKLKPVLLQFCLVLSRFALMASLGFEYASMHAISTLSSLLPEALEGKPIQIIGYIVSMPENITDPSSRFDESTRFEFQVEKTIPEDLWPSPGRIRLRWDDPPVALKAGEGWQFTVKLKRPRSYANPGSFDNERYFFLNRWMANGYVYQKMDTIDNKNKSMPIKLRDKHHWYSGGFDRLRAHICQQILTCLQDRPLAGLIAALIVSAREHITPEQWIIFQETGTNHLMAMPGLHVSLAASIVYVLIHYVWRRLPSMFLVIPAHQASAVLGLLTAFFYGTLAMFQRGVFMVVVLMLGIFLARKICYWRSFFLAMGAMLLVDPFSPLSPGFWLSFGAVALIFYGMRGRVETRGLWWKWGRTQWIVCLGLMPASLAIFGMVSLVAPIVNIIAIPWVSFTVVPLGLLGAFFAVISGEGDLFGSLFGTLFGSLSRFFLRLSERSLHWLWQWLEYFQHLSHPSWSNTECHWMALGAAMLGMMWILAPKGFPGKILGLVFLLPLLFLKSKNTAEGTALVTVLDVGQGLSVVIETQHHLLVYDTGPKFNSNFDTGGKVVEPYLKTRGKKEIDTIIISHGDNDHVGGLASLVQKMPVKEIITSEKELVDQILGQQSGQQSIACYAGQQWEWDGVYFEMLHPGALNTKKRNDHCCVLRVKAGSETFLLTGDIEVNSERQMLERLGKKLGSNILLVPHHGSKTSSSVEFIQAVNPTFAIIPAGYRNQYGHPKEEILARYKALGVKLYDTIHGGAISFILGDKTVEKLGSPSQYRVDHRRYWNGK